MKTSMIVAIVGVIGLVAFAGTVVAAESLSLGTAANGNGTGGMSGMGGMHGGMHQNGYQYQYNQSESGCPMYNNYNYSWDNDYGGCGCSGR